MHQPQPERLTFPERSFVVQRRANEPVAFEEVHVVEVEELMSMAERQYRDMESVVEDWTLDVDGDADDGHGHGRGREFRG